MLINSTGPELSAAKASTPPNTEVDKLYDNTDVGLTF
jgi:hypothetical protein